MISATDVRKTLRQASQSRIYSRGLEYWKQGCVVKWSVTEDDDNKTVTVRGEVAGNDIYEVTLIFDLENTKPAGARVSCTCPYGSVCKHIVALGLAYADSLSDQREIKAEDELGKQKVDNQTITETAPTITPEVDETSLRKVFQNLGLAGDFIPEQLIRQLLAYKSEKVTAQSNPTQAIVSTARRSEKPFNPNDYFFTLTRYSGYEPTLHEKNNHYEQASTKKILQRNDISEAQRELLLYIKNGKFGHYLSTPADPIKLLPLIASAGIPVYDYVYGNKRKVTIELKPQPLRAWISYDPVPMYGEPDKVRHDFHFRMPTQYWTERRESYYEPFKGHGEYIIHDSNNVISLHKLSPLLAQFISRVQAEYDYNETRANRWSSKAKYYQTKLTGEEVTQVDALRSDMNRLLTIEHPCPEWKTQKSNVFQPSFIIDFDNEEQELRVTPMIDYGIYHQNISESVFLRRSASGNTLAYREPFEQPGSTIVTVKNDVVHHATIQKEKEIELHRELSARAESIGFTKTLKCLKRGHKNIAEYLGDAWGKLSTFAAENKYPMIFTKDELATKKTTFNADFTADIKADNNWLYFDLECYCGDERVTLQKLQEYLKSGQPFWRKSDGTLVQISNKEELERLVRLLQSFHAREEGGFEGELHHAPELEYVMTSSEHYNSKRAESFRKFMAAIKKGKPVKKVRLPKNLLKILRPYQKAGIEWLYFLRSYRFAGILADDMGLGKTIQALAVLDKEKVKGRPSIVICPKTLLYNWQIEAKKFTPELNTLIYEGSKAERVAQRKMMGKSDLVIVSYGTFKRDEDFFTSPKMHWNYAILDEAQFIKNHATKNARGVKKLNADYRLALTGTPMENNVSELWSIYDFLMPGFLGKYEHFSEHFHKPIMDKGDHHAMAHLRHKVESFMLRRLKSEVLTELPAKIEQTSECELSNAQNVLYQQILTSVRAEVFGAVDKKGFKGSQIHILAGLTKLRQACNHPALLIEDKKNWRKYESAKLDMCMELAEEVAKSGRKVLIFSQFTKMLDIVSQALADREIEHLYLSGKTKDRQTLVDKFNSDATVPVFLISMKAGGTGLNLTAADTVIIFDPWWNPSVENQAVDRAHRIGQTKAINVYRLVTKGTIEEKIQALKQKKQQLFNSLVGESGDLFKKLTWDDIRGLFAG